MDEPLTGPNRQRGFALVDGLIAVGLTAACIHGLWIAHKIADHYSDIGGTAAAFAHFANAQRSYFEANPDQLTMVDFDQLVTEGHLTGATLIDATTAHLDNTDHTFEMRTIHGQPMLTTVVDYESRAQRIVRLIGPLASYAVDDPLANTFRVRLSTLRTSSLEELIESNSMHVAGPILNRLDVLNFGLGAVHTVGDVCQPASGVWMGGLAISSNERLLVCQKDYSDRDQRRWRVAGTYASLPFPTNRCGDGTVVANINSECKDCWNGSNVHISDTCPVQPRCGDGTLVSNASTECKDCWDGTNIHILSSCPVQPACGDGTIVANSTTECQDCWDGTNIHISATCPTPPPIQFCGDGTPVTDRLRFCEDCWDDTNIFLTTPSSCPPIVFPEYCGDGSPVSDSTTDCQDCWDGTNIPTTSTCPIQPACGDGTPVTDIATECKDCADDTNIHISGNCPTPQAYCEDGTRVTDRDTECKDCPNGVNIHISATCPVQEMCGDLTPVSDRAIECKDCQCGENVHVSATCPSPKDRCGNGELVCNAATDCKNCCDASNIPNVNACPVCTTCCDGSLATDPNSCPVEIPCWDGTTVCPGVATCPPQPTCGDGTLVNSLSECTACCDGSYGRRPRVLPFPHLLVRRLVEVLSKLLLS